jgi:hypothetical protein
MAQEITQVWLMAGSALTLVARHSSDPIELDTGADLQLHVQRPPWA